MKKALIIGVIVAYYVGGIWTGFTLARREMRIATMLGKTSADLREIIKVLNNQGREVGNLRREMDGMSGRMEGLEKKDLTKDK